MNQETNYVQELLSTLRTRLLVMCASVGIALEEATKALFSGEVGRAASVIDNDAAIDSLENEIDEMALRLLARAQPVAGDLRFVVSALRMVTDLERIADEAVNIAEQAILMHDDWKVESIPQQLHDMAHFAGTAFNEAVRIFREADAQTALRLVKNVDEAAQGEVRLLQGIMDGLVCSSMDRRLAMHLMLITHAMARIWRRSTNIAEHVYFISRGDSLKHRRNDEESATAAKHREEDTMR